jgi:translation initiation factor 2 subunit 1
MLLIKQGMPEEDELILCTVTSVQYHSVFCQLDEYNNKVGMIHISEVAPGRIRNIRDFVVEGKKVVCKVLRIHEDKGHIDLSLRRVNTAQKRIKLNEIKQQQSAEKIIEYVAQQLKQPVKKVYDDVASALRSYESIFKAFEAVVKDEFDLSTTKLNKKLVDELQNIVKQRIKPPEVNIGGMFSITTYDADGVGVIKRAFKKTEKIPGDFRIQYRGAGNYNIMVKAEEYKSAEKTLAKITKAVTTAIEATPNSTITFTRK